VLKNARIVNVYTREIVPGDIAILGERIVGIGSYDGPNAVDLGGRYVCPGLIDGHVHIESTLATPGEFARAVLAHGTTTIIADPHEIANVAGLAGIVFMINQARDLPLRVYYMMPSCVPATAGEHNGASLTAEAMEPLARSGGVLGLGEVMDSQAVLAGNQEMLAKLALFDGGLIDGHATGLTPAQLCGYRAVGVKTNHECTELTEVIDHIRLGLYVQVREGSAAKNIAAIVSGLLAEGLPLDRCLFCTDDKHLEDIAVEGHISHNVRKAISCGVAPVDAIRMATLNAAQCYGLDELGAVAPGHLADLVVLSDLDAFTVDQVYVGGQLVTSGGRKPALAVDARDPNVLSTVRIRPVLPEHLRIHVDDAPARVIDIVPGQILTRCATVHVPTDDAGCFRPTREFAKVAVVERHKATGSIGLGIVRGLGLTGGAIASTVAHDSHNLIVLGANDRDMLTAVQELKDVGGGMTVVSGGEVLATLPLPIAGLMSDRDGDWIEAQLRTVIAAARRLGVPVGLDPFTTLSFLALPVIPELRVTDQGLFDVSHFALTPIAAPESAT
jgi:adenine deaminase